MARILLIGGAGYIGSHANIAFAEAGHDTVVFDDLSTGFRELVITGELVRGDLSNKPEIDAVLSRGNFDLIAHFAAKSFVAESIENPIRYWNSNLGGTLNLLESVAEFGPGKLVFSSSAAVDGEREGVRSTASHPLRPMNPYGRTKLACEWAIRDAASAFDLKFANLRYFNAVGADPEGRVGSLLPNNPQLFQAILNTLVGLREEITIFGEDYPTPDGTCIRDYVHVTDLAEAHLAAAEYLLEDGDSFTANIGTGKGYSVREVLSAFRKVADRELPVRYIDRREGDPARSAADPSKAAEILGWKTRFTDLGEIVTSAWNFHQAHFGRHADSPD